MRGVSCFLRIIDFWYKVSRGKTITWRISSFYFYRTDEALAPEDTVSPDFFLNSFLREA
jgi:hypothetical protein